MQQMIVLIKLLALLCVLTLLSMEDKISSALSPLKTEHLRLTSNVCTLAIVTINKHSRGAIKFYFQL